MSARRPDDYGITLPPGGRFPVSTTPPRPTEEHERLAIRLWQDLDNAGGSLIPAVAEALAAAEARGHARGAAEAAQLRERVEGLAAEFDANLNWREWGVGNRIRRALGGDS